MDRGVEEGRRFEGRTRGVAGAAFVGRGLARRRADDLGGGRRALDRRFGADRPPSRDRRLRPLRSDGSTAASLERLVRSLSPRVGDAVLEWLKINKGVDRGMLLPLEVQGAIAHLPRIARSNRCSTSCLAPLAFRRRFRRCSTPWRVNPRRLSVESKSRLNEAVAGFFDEADRLGRSEPIAWASRREDAANWLEPWLRKLCSVSDNRNAWRTARSAGRRASTRVRQGVSRSRRDARRRCAVSLGCRGTADDHPRIQSARKPRLARRLFDANRLGIGSDS